MKLQVAYSSDDNYAVHLGVSMLSLFKANSDLKEIIVHILDNGITEINKENLLKICKKYNRKVIFHKIIFDDLIKINNTSKELSISSYGRIFLSTILNDVDKVIYLDCDSVVVGSLKDLWVTNIDDISIAGVLDNCIEQAKLKIGLKLEDSYVNAGFLVMNLKKMREQYSQDAMVNFLNENNGDVYHHDQGIINAIFNKDKLLIDPKYNVMTPFFDMNVKKISKLSNTKPYYNQDEINKAKSNPVFIHFTPSYSKRPWLKGCIHPYKDVYLDNLSETPWAGMAILSDNRKLRIRVLEKIYRMLPFFVYYSIIKLIRLIK